MGIKHIVFKVQTLTCCDNHVRQNNFANLEHVMKNLFFHYHNMLKSCNVELAIVTNPHNLFRFGCQFENCHKMKSYPSHI